MTFGAWTPILVLIASTAFLACGKEEKKSESENASVSKDDAAAAELAKRNSALAELMAGQQALDAKIKAAAARLEKQGNKTKKKLKPKFASLEAERADLASGLDYLRSLSDPEFTERSTEIRVRQDSLSKTLVGLEKSLK